jgi:methylenetetrahydrofolate dehydrogenase (NADP+)/methenyltetrahydrofolate cyclohydrolase
MIIDGRALAREVLARTKARAEKLPHSPRILAIVANETSATKSYLAIKKKRAADAGCVLEELRFDADTTTTEQLREAVLAADADAVIVQLPLAERMDSRIVCDAIPLEKDADILSTVARMKFEADEYDALVPPVASALAEILSVQGIDPAGKKAVVIGRGWLVGRPCATWLSHKKADVTHVSFRSGNFALLKDADIIVSGAGSPHFIKSEMLKDGVVLIDAGTSESSGMLAGDADPACAQICSVFTPVPGGVGPLAVAKLFENAVMLTERQGIDK